MIPRRVSDREWNMRKFYLATPVGEIELCKNNSV